jgi:hypothetical protein
MDIIYSNYWQISHMHRIFIHNHLTKKLQKHMHKKYTFHDYLNIEISCIECVKIWVSKTCHRPIIISWDKTKNCYKHVKYQVSRAIFTDYQHVVPFLFLGMIMIITIWIFLVYSLYEVHYFFAQWNFVFFFFISVMVANCVLDNGVKSALFKLLRKHPI